jgi:hypothetical protein
MEMKKYEVQELLRHYWKENYKAATAAAAKKKICDVEGEGAVNERTVQRWFKRFASCDLNLDNEQCLG